MIGGVLEGRKARVLLQPLREELGSLRIEPVVAEAATEQQSKSACLGQMASVEQMASVGVDALRASSGGLTPTRRS